VRNRRADLVVWRVVDRYSLVCAVLSASRQSTGHKLASTDHKNGEKRDEDADLRRTKKLRDDTSPGRLGSAWRWLGCAPMSLLC